LIISAVTGTSGVAVLQGLSQCSGYQIVTAAFDSNGDGLNDYVAIALSYGFVTAYDNTTVSIALLSIPPYGYT
jgi:hypothetical protein